MNKAESDFQVFKQEFKYWQEKFGLTGYQIYFSHEDIGGCFADIKINQGDMVVKVRLNSKLSKENQPYKDIKRSAKHEAIHLLVGRLEQDGRYRYCSEPEIYEATEELVHRLEGLIDGNNR